MSDVIEVIFPEQAIHAVTGPTGAGKTRWLVEMLREWEQGHPIFGFKSNPRPWLYVCGDRALHQTRGVIAELGIDPDTIPLFEAFGLMPPVGALGVLAAAEEHGASLLVWEGFGGYVDSNWGSTKVKQWLNMMTWRLTHKLDGSPRDTPLTIIGVMEQPKMKPRDKYLNPRQRISGPAAWGYTLDTIVNIEHANVNCEGPYRRMWITPHQKGAQLIFQATMETGHFVLLPEDTVVG